MASEDRILCEYCGRDITGANYIREGYKGAWKFCGDYCKTAWEKQHGELVVSEETSRSVVGLLVIPAIIGVIFSFMLSKILIGLVYLSVTPNPLCIAASLLITLGGMFLTAFIANRKESRKSIYYEISAKRIKNLVVFTIVSILLSMSLVMGVLFCDTYKGASPYIFVSLLAMLTIFLFFRLKAIGLMIISLAFVIFDILLFKKYEDPLGCLFALLPFAVQVWLGFYYTKNNFFFASFKSMVHRPRSFSDLFYKGYWLESWLPFLAICVISFFYTKAGVVYIINNLFAI